MVSYRHHGSRIVGLAEPARRIATRDSVATPVNVYTTAGGPRPEGLPDPAQVSMPEPGGVPESRTQELLLTGDISNVAGSKGISDSRGWQKRFIDTRFLNIFFLFLRKFSGFQNGG